MADRRPTGGPEGAPCANLARLKDRGSVRRPAARRQEPARQPVPVGAAGGRVHVPGPDRRRRQRGGAQAVARETDQRRQLRMFADIVAYNLNQVAAVFEIMTDAARIEPDFERIVQKLNKQRLEHMTLAVQQIAANGPFRETMDKTYARDIVWMLTSGEVFLLLTRDRGWSKEQYADWLADMLIRALLP